MFSTHVQSIFWVTAQFLLVFMIALWSLPWHLQAGALIFGGASILMGFWVMFHNRPGNFRIRPEPLPTARLITTGPYRYMRHPMYITLLLATLALVSEAPNTVDWTLWGALLVVLNFKASLEERLLEARWPEYAKYRSHTRRFIPGLW